MADSFALDPLHAFNFVVAFNEEPLGDRAEGGSASRPSGSVALCHGAFSEVTGLEATVEPFSINEGGRNWGQHHRVGRTTFSTVILKRGVTVNRNLWKWFQALHADGAYKHRLTVTITLRGADGKGRISWTLQRAMPVKMKLADLSASGADVAVEELHLVHEGLLEKLEPEQDSSAPNNSGSQGA